MRSRLDVRAREAALNLGRVRAGVHAELTDVVQELLLPVAQRDEEKIGEALEKYAKGL